MSSVPRLSVIIPVYRDWPRLHDCLAALARQTLPASDFEVLVVNNDEAPAPAEFASYRAQLLHAPEGHSYAARNAALAVARGAVLAFTDADCVPAETWLEAGWQAVQGEAALAGGGIDIRIERPGVVADYDRAFAFRQDIYALDGCSVTANLFVRREVFERAGTFDASMQSSGDFEFCRRAAAAGFRLRFAPEARVAHPARDSLAAILRKNRRVAGGYRRREFDLRGQGLGARLRFAAEMLKPRLRYWARMLAGRERTADLPLPRRAALVLLHALLHYHFALSVLRAPPDKDQH